MHTKDSIRKSSIFSSNTASCESPCISITPSSIVSPDAEPHVGPFEPVFSRTSENVSSMNSRWVLKRSKVNVVPLDVVITIDFGVTLMFTVPPSLCSCE
mgnify:CR=1 FL=1